MSLQQALFEPERSLNLPTNIGRAKVASRRVKQILTKPKGSLQGFDFTINPYIGCSFACEYCYAAFFQADDNRIREWGLWVEVKEGALESLRREKKLSGARIMIGSATDPYQPIEKVTRITRSLLEEMLKVGPQPKIRIQTRSPIITRDLDILQQFKDVTVGMSITTESDVVRKRYEPSCASIEQRFASVRKLCDAGIPTVLTLAPLLPVKDVERLAHLIRESGASKFWTGYFHSNTRKFAANTRKNALVLAKEDGWNFESYFETVSQLKKMLPDLVCRDFDEL